MGVGGCCGWVLWWWCAIGISLGCQPIPLLVLLQVTHCRELQNQLGIIRHKPKGDSHAWRQANKWALCEELVEMVDMMVQWAEGWYTSLPPELPNNDPRVSLGLQQMQQQSCLAAATVMACSSCSSSPGMQQLQQQSCLAAAAAVMACRSCSSSPGMQQLQQLQ